MVLLLSAFQNLAVMEKAKTVTPRGVAVLLSGGSFGFVGSNRTAGSSPPRDLLATVTRFDHLSQMVFAFVSEPAHGIVRNKDRARVTFTAHTSIEGADVDAAEKCQRGCAIPQARWSAYCVRGSVRLTVGDRGRGGGALITGIG